MNQLFHLRLKSIAAIIIVGMLFSCINDSKKVRDFLAEKNLGTIVKDSAMSDAIIMQQGNKVTLNATNGLDAVDKNDDTRGSTSVEDVTNKLFDFAQGQYLKKISVKNYDYEF